MGLCYSYNPEGLFVHCRELFDVYWNGKKYRFGYGEIPPLGYKKIYEKIIFYPGREVHVIEIKKCVNRYRYKLRFSPSWANFEATVWISKSEYDRYWMEYLRDSNRDRF